MWLDLITLIGGGLGVWLGAEGMVRGAVKLAAYLGVPSLIVGLTVVAFGTSAPELVVSSLAAVAGHNQLALGNVIGSNIINICLVLGLSALITPIVISTDVLRRDIPVVVAATLAVVLMVWIGDGVGRIDAAILLFCFLAHTIYTYRVAVYEQGRTTSAPGWEQPEFQTRHIVYLIGGTIILAIGAEGMVHGAVNLAAAVGISQRVIGMTIVAFGTSVPELAASAVAARHGESDLAVGNIVGSNLYNMLLILGTAAMISPISAQISLQSVDFLFFVVSVLMLVPMMRVGWRLGRVDGTILIGTFIVSTGSLLLV